MTFTPITGPGYEIVGADQGIPPTRERWQGEKP